MARRVFFSFHYQRDIWRVNQIRNIPALSRIKQQPILTLIVFSPMVAHCHKLGASPQIEHCAYY